MVGKKIEDRTEHGRITEARAQFIRRQAGEAQEPLGTVAIGQDPAESLQRERGGVDRNGRLADDCQGLSRAIRVAR